MYTLENRRVPFTTNTLSQIETQKLQICEICQDCQCCVILRKPRLARSCCIQLIHLIEQILYNIGQNKNANVELKSIAWGNIAYSRIAKTQFNYITQMWFVFTE